MPVRNEAAHHLREELGVGIVVKEAHGVEGGDEDVAIGRAGQRRDEVLGASELDIHVVSLLDALDVAEDSLVVAVQVDVDRGLSPTRCYGGAPSHDIDAMMSMMSAPR